MKIQVSWQLAAALGCMVLTACGGGGGNPGSCGGSDEVCERAPGTGNTNGVPASVTPSTPATTTTTATGKTA
jgi:hypothetical protein